MFIILYFCFVVWLFNSNVHLFGDYLVLILFDPDFLFSWLCRMPTAKFMTSNNVLIFTYSFFVLNIAFLRQFSKTFSDLSLINFFYISILVFLGFYTLLYVLCVQLLSPFFFFFYTILVIYFLCLLFYI